MKNIYLIFLLALIGCSSPDEPYRLKIDLRGNWQFELDTANTGTKEKWYLTDLDDFITLPGTTDLCKKGLRNTDTTTMHLNRLYRYEGVAWYRKKLIIPENFRNKHIELFLERTKSTKVWIDSTLIGQSRLLQSPQVYDVSEYLTPGVHHLTVEVNNDLRLTPYGNVHIYSDDTQTNWNGILGNIFLEASEKTYIANLQVIPDIEQHSVDVLLEIVNQLNLSELNIVLLVDKIIDDTIIKLPPQTLSVAAASKLRLSYKFEEGSELWDEYRQPLYRLTAVISNKKVKDDLTVTFGMRDFRAEGKQFTINGRTTFLRGKHDSAVFPLTGFPPMEVEEWERVFRIAKSYGINHYRFHSYCPPEAAFAAADREGIYLQPELPFWGGLEADTVAQMLRDEGLGMLKTYANHPSFVMFSPGNELWEGHDRVEQVMLDLKDYDSRPLYTMGSNNNIGYLPPRSYSEYFIGARIPGFGDSISGHTRLTHAFADAPQGGTLNTQTPSTSVDFNFAVSQMDMPLVSHEIGQYQIYPDYSEIDKYTGVLKAWNLEVFRKRLEVKGMAQMDELFQQASGAWSALCYKAEMEAALRTENMAGFQLLDLQDFPGQGTALVGILDAFMDSKEVVTQESWRQSCNNVVILPVFSKYCWTNTETFESEIKVANYSNKTIDGQLDWEIRKQDGTVAGEGSFTGLNADAGGLHYIGSITQSFASLDKAEKLNFSVTIPGTEYKNTYPLWVYPVVTNIEIPPGVTVAEKLTGRLLTQLQKGASVLLFPQPADVRKNSLPGHFPPEFWNYGMFKQISERVNKPVSPGTLGILTDPGHPIFNAFPTDFHTNWQWFSIIKAGNPLILDSTPADYLPIVQVIDNLERNHKLGLIFEFMVGEGKLLVCMSALNKLPGNPEAVQLYRSILNYMDSADFKPAASIIPADLYPLFK